MASQQSFVDYVCDQMAGAGTIASRPMFGEFGLYCDDIFIGVICRDSLFLKITKPGEAMAPALDRQPAYQGAKPSFAIPEERIEDREWLAAFTRATCDGLPPKRPRKPSASKR